MAHTEETLNKLEKSMLVCMVLNYQEKLESVENQLQFFKKNMFGRKSEKIVASSSYQYPLPFTKSEIPQPEIEDKEEEVIEEQKIVKKRVKSKREEKFFVDENGLKFDNSLSVEEEVILPEEAKNLTEDQYEVIGKKTSYYLAKRQSLYVKKIVRPEIKLKVEDSKDETKILTAKLPDSVTIFDDSMFDVSFLASMIEEKYRYHMPLNRQFKKIEATGVRITRSVLTKAMLSLSELLKPIYKELKKEILKSHVIMMDETPIKAGCNEEKHSMKMAYFWGIHGDNGTAFTFSPTRSGENISKILGDFTGVILTDGYSPYATYAAMHPSIQRAQCWAHVRRKFNNALSAEPKYARGALEYISRLYKVESENKNDVAKLRDARQTKSKQIFEELFIYLRKIASQEEFLNSNLFKKALMYAFDNEDALSVMLSDVKVPIDTNALERDNRYSAVGRKNYMFHWTEEGAECSAIMYSLVVSCVQNNISPFEYFSDVLTRIQNHKSDINQLIPCNWKKYFSISAKKNTSEAQTPTVE